MMRTDYACGFRNCFVDLGVLIVVHSPQDTRLFRELKGANGALLREIYDGQ